MATAKPTTIDGLISTGYECEDYSKPTPDGVEPETHTCYPTFRVCKEAGAALYSALTDGKLLADEFVAIVVLKNTMTRVSDDDEDEDATKDVELEFRVCGIMPHVEDGAGETEADILAAFDKLPEAKKDTGSDTGEEQDTEDDQD